MQHKTENEGGKIVCRQCQWSWLRMPQSECPGVPRYAWGEWSPELMTKTQLRRMKLKPSGEPRGAYYRNSRVGKTDQFMWLYDVAEAVPTANRSIAGKHASSEEAKQANTMHS